MFSNIYWKDGKGMFVTINNKDYFTYVGINDEDELIFKINKEHGKHITFDKNNNKDDYIQLLEKLANYNITRYVFNYIVDTLDKIGIKHNMTKEDREIPLF